MEAAKADPHDVSARIDALDWTPACLVGAQRRLRRSGQRPAATSCASIISLGIWVGRQTSKVVRREDTVESLIEINRMIMQGLAPKSVAAVAAA